MTDVLVRDVSRVGRELSRATVTAAPVRTTLRALLHRRIRDESAAHDPSRSVVVGLVQPHDAVRHSDGFHLRQPRAIDAEPAVAAFDRAVDGGLVTFAVDGTAVADPDAELDLTAVDEITVILGRSVVADA